MKLSLKCSNDHIAIVCTIHIVFGHTQYYLQDCTIFRQGVSLTTINTLTIKGKKLCYNFRLCPAISLYSCLVLSELQ